MQERERNRRGKPPCLPKLFGTGATHCGCFPGEKGKKSRTGVRRSQGVRGTPGLPLQNRAPAGKMPWMQEREGSRRGKPPCLPRIFIEKMGRQNAKWSSAKKGGFPGNNPAPVLMGSGEMSICTVGGGNRQIDVRSISWYSDEIFPGVQLQSVILGARIHSTVVIWERRWGSIYPFVNQLLHTGDIGMAIMSVPCLVNPLP